MFTSVRTIPPLGVMALLALATAALYLPGLENAPLYLVRDEVFFGLTAHSVATTGRDPYGVFLPLYFETPFIKHGNPMWFHPILMYAIAGALKLFAFSERTIRVPMVMAGIVNVMLMYRIGRLVFSHEMFAVAAALLLAVTPTHFMFSRVAMDYQVPLPFVLGWLLCVLTYLKRRDPRLLFVAGLLIGAGFYSYVAAAALMPMYAVLTCVVLFSRREPLRHYGSLALGIALPALLCVIFLFHHPTMFQDIAGRYRPDEIPGSASTLGTMDALFAPTRIVEAVTLYAQFWNPRFLFIDGPLRSTEATWFVGVFLMPIAGLFIVGLVRLLRRPADAKTMLIVGGLLLAPVPASFAGQGEAIRRALEVVPLVVLIAAFGLEHFWTVRRHAGRALAFVVVWGAAIALAIASHDHLPYAQAFVRAATAPLAIAGVALAFERFPVERLTSKWLALGAVATLPVIEAAYIFGRGALVDVLLATAFAAGLFLKGEGADERRRQLVLGVLLALIAGELTFYYVDYPVHRFGSVPASAIVLVLRSIAAFVVVAASIGAALLARRAANRTSSGAAQIAVVLAVALVGAAYFYVDLSVNPTGRFAWVLVLGSGAVGAAALSTGGIPLGRITAGGLLAFVCLQFGCFYADYFNRFQARGSGSVEGNVRVPLEYVLDLVRGRQVPAVYVARVRNEFAGLGRVYGHFYMLKHRRADMIPGAMEGETYSFFEPARLLQLPRGSFIIVNPSRRGDPIIEQWVATGEVKRKALLQTPDGTPAFWVLER